MPAQYMNNLNILSLDYYPIISYHTLLSTLNYIRKMEKYYLTEHIAPLIIPESYCEKKM